MSDKIRYTNCLKRAASVSCGGNVNAKTHTCEQCETFKNYNSKARKLTKYGKIRCSLNKSSTHSCVEFDMSQTQVCEKCNLFEEARQVYKTIEKNAGNAVCSKKDSSCSKSYLCAKGMCTAHAGIKDTYVLPSFTNVKTTKGCSTDVAPFKFDEEKIVRNWGDINESNEKLIKKPIKVVKPVDQPVEKIVQPLDQPVDQPVEKVVKPLKQKVEKVVKPLKQKVVKLLDQKVEEPFRQSEEEKLRKIIAELTKKNDQLQKDFDDQIKKNAKLSDEIKVLKEQLTDAQEDFNEQIEVNAELNNEIKVLKSNDEIGKLLEKNQILSDEIQKLNDEANENDDTIEELNVKIQELSDKANESDDTIKQLNDKIRELSDEANESDDTIKELNDDIQLLERAYESCKSESKPCEKLKNSNFVDMSSINKKTDCLMEFLNQMNSQIN